MVTAPLVCRAASVPRSALRCERPLESDLVGQRPISETCVDRAHRPIRLVVSGLEALEAVLDRPRDRRPLDRRRDAATPPRPPDAGHVMERDRGATGLEEQVPV